jgi:putative ABC transport system permease protein
MIRHLLRLTWNRKRSTALLLLELFVTFLVVALVSTTALYQASNWRRPLGFEPAGVLVARIDYQRSSDDFFEPAEVEGFTRLLQEVRALPEVEAAAGCHVVPFDLSSMESEFEHDGERFESSLNEVTDDFERVMGLEIVAGRWFSPADDGAGPVVLDRDLAVRVFGSSQAAIGQSLQESDGETPEVADNRQVVGVVADYRAGGELSGPGNFFFERVRVGDTGHRPPGHILLRLRPGTGVAFGEPLARRLQALAPAWSFDVQPLSDFRRTNLRLRVAPLVAGGIVGSFLFAMVALGLVGVVWQNVSERTREIGLRRAVGATGPAIRRQFVLEMLLLAAVAIAAGALVAIQLPLLDMVGAVPLSVVAGGLGSAGLGLLLVSGLAAWLPSRLASRITPSAALRYE